MTEQEKVAAILCELANLYTPAEVLAGVELWWEQSHAGIEDPNARLYLDDVHSDLSGAKRKARDLARCGGYWR